MVDRSGTPSEDNQIGVPKIGQATDLDAGHPKPDRDFQSVFGDRWVERSDPGRELR